MTDDDDDNDDDDDDDTCNIISSAKNYFLGSGPHKLCLFLILLIAYFSCHIYFHSFRHFSQSIVLPAI